MQRSLRQYDHPQRHPAVPTSPPRSGFSLIELMAVIIVIAILAALLLPAVNNVRRTAQEARVVADIKNLEAAIAAFKLKFGTEPPSSFRIYESGVWDLTVTLDKNSVAVIRQLWPSLKMAKVGTNMVVVDPTTGMPGQLGDLNGNGSVDNAPITLNGAECLAFFLGGPGLLNLGGSASIPVPASVAATGFSANPINPFAAGGSRVGPFLEIDTSRLSDVNGNGNYELLDPLPNQTMPYQYFSSYEGRGYQVFGYDTLNNNTLTADDEILYIGTTATLQSEYLKTDPKGSGNGNPGYTATSGSPSMLAHSPAQSWNAKTYQIISPGFDGEYGIGGLFTTGGANTSGDGVGISTGDAYRDSAKRSKEIDNITNFAAGRLNKTYTPSGW